MSTLFFLLLTLGSAGDAAEDGAVLFRNEVRPVLEEHCFRCHGPEARRPKGGLLMSSRENLLHGGRSGPAITPGDAEGSLMVRAIRYVDPDLTMPPREQLSDHDVDTLVRWIALGAPWPADAESEPAPGPSHRRDDAWPYGPLERPDVPTVDFAPVVNPIDAFVYARLEAAGIEPNPRADDRELVRRAHFDLLGYPAPYSLVEAYVGSKDPNKWQRLVDRLLAQPQYGERWGRMWLDVVRYAESNGYELDSPKPYAWRYRDYVIRAFNEDKPYDQFLREQIAGDELDKVTDDAIIAGGFYHLGPWDSEPDDPLQAEFDFYDDVVRTIGEGVLGVTLGCARCHDHKFEPIPQEDYYRFLAFVRNVKPYGKPTFAPGSDTHYLLHPIEDRARWARERDAHVAALRAKQAAIREENGNKPREQLPLRVQQQLFIVDAEIADAESSFAGSLDWALTTFEFGREAKPTHVLGRGSASDPLEEVEPRFPRLLCVSDEATRPTIDPPAEGASTSHRRRALADWIASPENPMTARVMVNRIWQGHFGRGIVATPNDFGSTGMPPTHPELLDWLASEFISRGWSVKEMHRLIMGSNVYRMSSRADNARAQAADPDNLLLSRQNLRRLDAESVRDSLLAVGGELNFQMGGPSFFPDLGRDVLAGASRPGKGWGLSAADERHRRSVYIHAKRGMAVPMLQVFDCADPFFPVGKRPVTLVASQALSLLNGELADQCATELAARTKGAADDAERVRDLFRLALVRDPEPAELEACLAYLREQTDAFSAVTDHMVFAPRVPDRLDGGYLEIVPGTALFLGPRDGWRYLRGLWTNEYNATLEVDPDQGPAALLQAPELENGKVGARLRLTKDCDFAALLLRASAEHERYHGLEIKLSAGALRVVAHTGAPHPRLLTEVAVAADLEQTLELVVELRGNELSVSLEGQRVAQVSELPPFEGKSVGIRCWGGPLHLDALRVSNGREDVEIRPESGGSPSERAFEALCLAVLNLNEFVYVD